MLPLPEKNVPAYRKMAQAAGRIFCKHGDLAYREYIGSDLKAEEGIMAFPQVIKLKSDEVLIYASVEFKSESHRNKVMKLIFKDPTLEEMMTNKPIFDTKQMVYGGFKILVETGEK